jgi:hypothetical protein
MRMDEPWVDSLIAEPPRPPPLCLPLLTESLAQRSLRQQLSELWRGGDHLTMSP